MRIGYSYWGFLGDVKLDEEGNELSTPDGNATYGWSIIWEMQRRGHTVYTMQEDRDYPAWKRLKGEAFSAFSKEKRLLAYEGLLHTRGETFPELDVLLLEWRFPIPGRNCSQLKVGGKETGSFHYDPWKHQPDLYRQWKLIEHYKSAGTKIILWDLDHKLEKKDEESVNPDAIFETSQKPLELSKKRTVVQPPVVVSDLLQHPTLPSDPNRKLVYIGSRYERDDVIDEWIKPFSDKNPGKTFFWGKWEDKTPGELKQRWPGIECMTRCTVKDFKRIYESAASVPLLAKRGYLETGFITPRVWEALLFGSIPIGLGTARGIEKYVLGSNITKDAYELEDIVERLSTIDAQERDKLRRENVEQIAFMDVRYFVDEVERTR